MMLSRHHSFTKNYHSNHGTKAAGNFATREVRTRLVGLQVEERSGSISEKAHEFVVVSANRLTNHNKGFLSPLLVSFSASSLVNFPPDEQSPPRLWSVANMFHLFSSMRALVRDSL